MQKKTKAELKDMIVDLKMQVISMSVPHGHCPYAYYKLENAPDINCSTVGCTTCKSQFYDIMQKRIRKEVENM